MRRYSLRAHLRIARREDVEEQQRHAFATLIEVTEVGPLIEKQENLDRHPVEE